MNNNEFATKNKNRKAFHQGNNDARRSRRALGGKFGNVSKSEFTELARGTSKG